MPDDETAPGAEITASRQQVAALRGVRLDANRFSRIFRLTPDSVTVSAERTGQFIDANPGFERLLGYRRDEVLGRTSLELGMWRDPADRARLVGGVRDSGEVWNMQVELRTRTGDRRVTELSALPLEEEGERRLLIVAHDITARQLAQEALEREKAIAEAAMDSVPGFFFVINSAGELVRWNANVERLLGFAPGEFGGTRVGDRAPPEDRDAVRRAFHDALATGSSTLEARIVAADGRAIPFLYSAQRVALDGAPHVVGVGIDITERKRLEDDLMELRSRERERIGQDLHDGLGQQLTGLAFLARALEQRLAGLNLPEAEQARRLQEHIAEATRQTRFLARGLLPVAFDGAGLGGALEELAANAAELYHLSCEALVDPAVTVDDPAAPHLYQIAREAVTNAARHARAREVEVMLARVQGRVTLQVSDDGVGIPAQPGGTDGIGLRIMKQRARLLRAELAVGPGGHGGTVVRVVLPAPPPGTAG